MHMAYKQAIFAADQVGLLDPEQKRLLQDIFAERYTCPRRLPAPFQALRANAVLYRLIDLLRKTPQGMHDRLTDCRPHDRVKRIAVSFRIVTKCLLQAFANGLRYRLDELAVFFVALVDGFREYVCDVGRPHFPTFDSFCDRIQRLLLSTEQELF